ncbi:hypothetical protein [Rubricoccus marinus]|uniref:Uncharacterized protein n=1 Tax=Rubricoccus marinus TaxID=716817 RepID=A0A259TYL4_9BACT|nr:hypothetical protein [Rubricoccus marinus]OZC02664.1 hypothetical protein BSZ36_06555 [Rubricoccus marinus]
MTRSALLPFGLAALVALSGCSDILSQRLPDTRRAQNRKVERRSDNRAWNRLDRDARAYAQLLDRQLRLSDNDERQIRRILEERGDRLRRDRRNTYPFPRRMRTDRYADRTVERFWRDADKRIERVLSRSQVREYRVLTGRASGNNGRREQRRGRKRN